MKHEHSQRSSDDLNDASCIEDAPTDLATDPVCRMSVPRTSSLQRQYQGNPYWFCSNRCQEKFDTAPATYIGKDAGGTVESDSPDQRAAQSTPDTEFTCPMHPEIRQIGPGTCPTCGMSLEPVMPTLESSEDEELVDFRKRLWRTLPLTVIVTMIAMSGGYATQLLGSARPWIELILATPVVLYSGWPFYVRCVQSILSRNPNMWTLIGIGTSAAYLYSVFATVFPGIFPASFRVDGHVAVYFEAAAVIISLTLMGQVLELKARSETGAAIKALLGLAPKTARRLEADGSEQDVPLTQVHTGDRLRIRLDSP